MDLKEIKALILFAKKQGAVSLKFGELEIEFHESLLRAPTRRRPRGTAPLPLGQEEVAKEPPAPSLQDINDYIYAPVSDAG